MVQLMKFVIWAVTGFLALLWTGAAALLAAAVNWLSASIADPAIRNVPSPAQWPVPEWLALWMPPAIIEQLKAGLTGPLDLLVNASTWIGPMLGWLLPVIWVVWGLLLVVMLALAAGVHMLVARTRRVQPAV